jgi:hypothetical protein
MRYVRTSVKPSVLFALAAGVAACSGGAYDEAPIGPQRTTSAPIIRGVVDDARGDAVVMIVHELGADSGTRCTGTLIAANVVVTARHCVSATISRDVPGDDFEPATLFVHTGPRPLVTPDAGVRRIVHDGSGSLEGHDFALLVLDREVGHAIASVRLASPPLAGEKVFAVGYGITELDRAPSERTHARYRRDGLDILLVGPSKVNDIGPQELVVGESTCQGDSGGPLMDASTHALVAISARGGNGAPATSSEPWAPCVAPVYNLFTRIDAFAPLVRATLAEVSAAPVEEVRPPTYRALGGGGCTVGADAARAPAIAALAIALAFVSSIARRRYRRS